MADLDDFFAKKDRKKSKGKKFATTEEVAKKLEDTTKKTEKNPKKDRPEGDETGTLAHEQDEWREYEEEKKDYTGLKIGNLSIGAQETGGGSGGGAESNFSEQQGGEDMGGAETERSAPGPWRSMDERKGLDEGEPQEVLPVPAPAPTVSSNSGAYVPPSLRGQSQQQPLQPSRLRSRAAPDIHSEEYFPSLSSTKADQRKTKAEGSFEVVSHGKASSYRHAEQSKVVVNRGPKLNLDNRYNTLSNDS